MLTLDSFSRNHFFRKLDRTVDLLNDISKSSNFTIFDFKLHNVHASDSIENMLPIFGETEQANFLGDQDVDKLGEKGLWNIFRELGFVSVLGFENCDFRFPDAMGRKPKFDHIAR
jgi:hypothetical protein